MKKISPIVLGVCAPLFHRLIFNIMLHIEYNENFSAIQNAMIFILPALPGVALGFLLIRNKIKEYLKSFGICFLTSIAITWLYDTIGVDMIIFKHMTGYDEIYYGEALMFLFTYLPYLISCFIGIVVAGIITIFRQKNKVSMEDVQ